LNKPRQQNNRGGGNRQNQQAQGNEPVVEGPTAGVVFADIMRGVDGMAATIQQSLPTDVSFGRFRATLMMAMRHNPDIMHCSVGSIITGAMKAAIDGVVLDGKEAALVPSSNKVKDFQTGREFYRKDARYNIMVAGIRISIMKGGKVRDLQSTVVYANEKFNYERGLNPRLEHTPILDNEARGAPVGAYSIAWFVDGGTPSFEVMNKVEILKVRDAGQSGPVWKGPFDTEMWRKTVVRRHRKALPGQETRFDQELTDGIGGFTAQYAPVGGHDGVLPAKQQAADAPQRKDFIALTDEGADTGQPLDFGRSGEMTAEEVQREEQGEPVQEQQQMRGGNGKFVVADEADGYDRGGEQEQEPVEEQQQEPVERVVGPVPEGFETWAAWGDSVATRMKTAATLPKLDTVTRETNALYEQAPDDVRIKLLDLYEEKAADHRAAAQ
jgi:recombination protein RecT